VSIVRSGPTPPRFVGKMTAPPYQSVKHIWLLPWGHIRGLSGACPRRLRL